MSLTFSCVGSPGHTQGSCNSQALPPRTALLRPERQKLLLYSLTGFISFEMTLPHNLGKQDNRILRALQESKMKKSKKTN